MPAKKIVVLLSGGFRSTSLLYDLHARGHDLYPVVSYTKEEYERPAVATAASHCLATSGAWKTIVLPALAQTTAPGHQALLYFSAALYAHNLDIRLVATGAFQTLHTTAPDSATAYTIDLIAAVNRLCLESRLNTRIIGPYLYVATAQLLGKVSAYGLNPETTWNCDRHGPTPCHTCRGCQAFESAQKEAALINASQHA